MKRPATVLVGVAFALVATFAVGRLVGQAPADRATVEKTVAANEQKISDAFTKKDIATLKTLIADDAFGTDMMGTNSIGEMYKQFPTMDMKLTEQHMADFKYIWVNPTTVVLTYTWTGKGTMNGQPVPSPAYASTVYTKRGEKWMAVFHQETVAAPAPKK
jgi:ketosteroid isomerase-like protein